jgi:RecJ-like exonuclease
MAILKAYKPKFESGRYFRAIGGSWKPLADFVIDTCPELLRDGEIEGWYSNTGHIVAEETATAIANKLDRLIRGGVAKRREIELLIAFPPIRCGACEGTGLKDKNKCPDCNGKGELQRSHFSEENVKKFAEFCRNSGGFDIY